MITQKSPAPVSRKGGIATLVAFVPHPTHPPLGDVCVCGGGGGVSEGKQILLLCEEHMEDIPMPLHCAYRKTCPAYGSGPASAVKK
jgi:hypothetical protein